LLHHPIQSRRHPANDRMLDAALAEPEDLSGNLIVQLGLVTEPLNRLWFERNTGQVITDVLPMTMRASEPPMKARRSINLRKSGALISILVLRS
jgi:hypothetical protein